MHPSPLRILVTTGALLLAPLSMASANLIVNGSFESPDIPTGTFQIFGSILGWNSTEGRGIEIQDHVAGSPFDGDQHVELDSTNNSNMIQSIISTVPGAVYTLSFAYSPRPGRGADDNGIDVFFNAGLVTSITASGFGLEDTSWTVHSFSVTATASVSTVSFLATGLSTSFGGYLDAISFVGEGERVPEPSTVALLMLGLAGLLRRRA